MAPRTPALIINQGVRMPTSRWSLFRCDARIACRRNSGLSAGEAPYQHPFEVRATLPPPAAALAGAPDQVVDREDGSFDLQVANLPLRPGELRLDGLLRRRLPRRGSRRA